MNDFQQQFEQLTRRRGGWGDFRTGHDSRLHSHSTRDVFSSGYPPLDALLPQGGFRRSTLVEWFPGESRGCQEWNRGVTGGSGAGTLSFQIAVTACQQGGSLVVVASDSCQQAELEFYPPAALAWGISEEQLVIVRPRDVQETVWCLDQALRSPAVSAVWAPVDHLVPRSFRRLQLSAEAGTSLGCLLRPGRARQASSWSDLQLSVEPDVSSHAWKLRIRCLRARGQHARSLLTGKSAMIDLHGASSYGT